MPLIPGILSGFCDLIPIPETAGPAMDCSRMNAWTNGDEITSASPWRRRGEFEPLRQLHLLQGLLRDVVPVETREDVTGVDLVAAVVLNQDFLCQCAAVAGGEVAGRRQLQIL